MKKKQLILFARASLFFFLALAFLLFFGQRWKQSVRDPNTLIVGVSGDYPPFEHYDFSELKGFDIDFSNKIGTKLGKKVIFKDMEFNSILLALANGVIDVAISSITVVPERTKNFDASRPYFFSAIGFLVRNDFKARLEPNLAENLKNCKVGTQMGSSMELWFKNFVQEEKYLFLYDDNNAAVEDLKNYRIDLVVINDVQARNYVAQNNGIKMLELEQKFTADGYAVFLPQGSPLKNKINDIIDQLEAEGFFEELEAKWLK